MDEQKLFDDYQAKTSIFKRYADSIRTQLLELLDKNSVTLGIPIECRVKSWSSIAEKIKRNSLGINTISKIPDLIGLRIIVLFKRDLYKTFEAISNTFMVVSEEDTAKRLGETQFGYQSLHLIIKAPDAWLSLPTFRGSDELCAEIQMRTLAQHIWAAASHKLQYKKESGVPLPVRRAIHRVSALLETVDLEFERVLKERDDYISGEEVNQPEAPLNVDVLSAILDKSLPDANRGNEEHYDKLLSELENLGINNISKLRSIIAAQLDDALKHDVKKVKQLRLNNVENDIIQEQIEQGVYYTHVGLMRLMCELELGNRWRTPK